MERRYLWLLIAICLPVILLGLFQTSNSYAKQPSVGGPAVLIDALYYDGLETGEPDEAVRLVNLGGSSTILTGWQITDGVSSSVVMRLFEQGCTGVL